MVDVLADTSALYALLDEDDTNHRPAARAWGELLDASRLVTHAYVIVECSALVQRRLGMDAAEHLHAELLPVVEVRTVDQDRHRRAVTRWRAAASRQLSLVDVTSFVVMDELAIDTAFAFDADFADMGFATVP